MEYQVLARKWRPKTFEEVIGQNHITKTLQNAVTGNRIHHAFLFSGVRGVGKTTMARILAKALNCAEGPTPVPCNRCESCIEISAGISLDTIEIDGASNTSVEDVRELREKVKYVPLKGRYKVYIIDEVHMLSNPAFNALLKTLEEPPPNVIFIFATTEFHKIPATIVSRCQHFNFKRIPQQEIVGRLRKIAETEGIEVTDNGLALIARAGEGSVRDALSILDQVVSFSGNKVSDNDIITILGIVEQERLLSFSKVILEGNAQRALLLIKDLMDNGFEIRQFCGAFVQHLRDLLISKVSTASEELIDLPQKDIQDIKETAEVFAIENLQRLYALFSQAHEEMKWSPYPRFILEATVIKAMRLPKLRAIEEIVERLSALEGSVSSLPTRQAVLPAGEIGSQQAGASKETITTTEHPIDPPSSVSLPVSHLPVGQTGTGDRQALIRLEEWDRVVQRLKEIKPNIASFLEQGRVLEITEEGLTIGFNESTAFFIDRLQKEDTNNLIHTVLQETLQRDLRLNFVRLTPNSITVPDGRKDKTKESTPLLKEVLEVFDGKVVGVKGRSSHVKEDAR